MRPIVGVGAIVMEAGRIVLIERAGPPLQGQWSLPGGCVETGERLEEALTREVREETGLIVEPERLVEVYERILRDEQGRPEYHYVLLDYVCRLKGGTLRAADDAGKAVWVDPSGLDSLDLTEGTREVVLRAFATGGQGPVVCSGVDR